MLLTTFKLQSNEAHSSVRVCHMPNLWIIWALVLRTCCGIMTDKENYCRTMASCPAEVYVDERANTHLFAPVYFCLSHTPGKLSHWCHREEHPFCMRQVLRLIPLCSLSIMFIPSSLTRQEGNFKFSFCQHQHQNQSGNSLFVESDK